MTKIFSSIYKGSWWGDLSGAGSVPDDNMDYIEFLVQFIEEHNIKSVVDLGCGDFRISREVFIDKPHISYCGIDCVPIIVRLLSKLYSSSPHIKFKCMDFYEDCNLIPPADLYLVKDVLQHWTDDHVVSFMDSLVSSHSYQYLLLTNDADPSAKRNHNIQGVGAHRMLSSQLPPLKKYGMKVLFRYGEKEISLLT